MADRCRDAQGRFLPRLCTDPNCDGVLVADVSFMVPGLGGGRPLWRCDGLTHEGDLGPLVACDRIETRLETVHA